MYVQDSHGEPAGRWGGTHSYGLGRGFSPDFSDPWPVTAFWRILRAGAGFAENYPNDNQHVTKNGQMKGRSADSFHVGGSRNKHDEIMGRGDEIWLLEVYRQKMPA